MWIDFVFIAFILAVAVVDCLTRYIYDSMLIAAVLVCYPLLYFVKHVGLADILFGVLWGFSSYGLIYVITKFIYREEVFGQGDVLFNCFICGYLGLIPGVIASFLTFFVALLFVITRWIQDRSAQGKIEIPLAPAMAVSAVLSLYYYDYFIELIFYL